MPRSLSNAFRVASNRLQTDVAFLILLTIRYSPSKTIYRVTDNTEDIVSRGETYTAYPFALQLPVESGEEIGIAQLTIDNVDLLLVDMLREAEEAPRVDIEVVLSSAVDVVEIAVLDLALRDVQWDASTITAKLFNEDFLSQSFPSDIYNPQEFAGLFG